MFNERLKKLRNERGLTQEMLAEATNIPASTIRRLETNEESLPRKERLEVIADFFDTSVDYLLGRTEDPSPVHEETNKAIDPYLIFELVDKLTDDEIIEKYKHVANQKELDEKIIRNHLAHIRLLKSLKE